MLTNAGNAQLQSIALNKLHPHPDNPRLELRDDVVQQLASQISENGFGAEHAILVRPVKGKFQIISGHHRTEAARTIALSEVPCWVRDMDDDEAFMQLVLSNAQGELSPLEIGIHALKAVPPAQGKAGAGIAAYAKAIGRSDEGVRQLRAAAEVLQLTKSFGKLEVRSKPTHLYEISKAPRETWPALVAKLVRSGWTVADTASEVKTVQQFVIPERHDDWLSLQEVVAKYLSSGKPKPAAVHQLITTAEGVLAAINDNEWATDDDREGFTEWLNANAGGEAWDRKAINDRHVELIRAWAQRQADAVVAEDEPEQLLPDGIEIRLGDFRELFAGDWADPEIHWPMDGQVDAIITDPPYPAEFLELFGALPHDCGTSDCIHERD